MAEQTEGSIDIEASPDEVLATISDFEAYPEWAEVKTVEVKERDPEGRGALVAFEISAGGIAAEYTLRYDYADDGLGISWVSEEASGAVRDVQGGYDLEGSDGGTRVTYRMAVEPAMPLPGFLRRKIEKRIVQTALEGLKARVEGT